MTDIDEIVLDYVPMIDLPLLINVSKEASALVAYQLDYWCLALVVLIDAIVSNVGFASRQTRPQL